MFEITKLKCVRREKSGCKYTRKGERKDHRLRKMIKMKICRKQVRGIIEKRRCPTMSMIPTRIQKIRQWAMD